jgi:hypothetical protein
MAYDHNFYTFNSPDTWDYNVGHLRDTVTGGLPGNYTTTTGEQTFGGEWLHLSLYFIQLMYRTGRKFLGGKRPGISEEIVPLVRMRGNNNPLGGRAFDSHFLLRGDIHHTKFVELGNTDLVNFSTQAKGFKLNPVQNGAVKGYGLASLTSNYMTRSTNLVPAEGDYYFFKGLKQADCINYAQSKNMIH